MLRKLFLLLAIFITFYLSAHFYLRWKSRVEVDTIKTTKLIECEPNQVRALQIQRTEAGKDQSVRFFRQDTPEAGIPPAAQLARTIWVAETESRPEADATLLNHLAALVCEIYDPIPQRAEDFAAEKTVSRTQRIDVTIVVNGKEERHSLELGALGSDRQVLVRYQSAKGERVVKISPQLSELASAPLEKLLSRRVQRMSADDIQLLVAYFDGREKFALERNGAEWRLLVKGKAAKGSEDPDRFVNRLATLRALSVASGRAEECEGKSHRVAFRLRGLRDKKELVGFDYGPAGPLKACSSARAAVFDVHRDMLKYLDLVATK